MFLVAKAALNAASTHARAQLAVANEKLLCRDSARGAVFRHWHTHHVLCPERRGQADRDD